MALTVELQVSLGSTPSRGLGKTTNVVIDRLILGQGRPAERWTLTFDGENQRPRQARRRRRNFYGQRDGRISIRSFRRNPFAPNSTTSRWISSRLHCFRSGTSHFPSCPQSSKEAVRRTGGDSETGSVGNLYRLLSWFLTDCQNRACGRIFNGLS